MPVAVVGQLEAKLRSLLDERRLDTDELEPLERMLSRYRKQRKAFPHSLHLNVVDEWGQPCHLRVLAWRSPEWRETRLDCIDRHRRLYLSTSRNRVSFRIPRMLKSGTSPLLWDLTERVDAENLPWSFPGKRHLGGHLHQVDAFFRSAEDLAHIRLRDIDERDWEQFSSEIRRWATWSRRAGMFDDDLVTRLKRALRSFEETSLPRSRIVLTHGDLGPNNMMFATRGKPWLIDFDHLRRSVPADAIARLLTVSYYENAWRETVFEKALAAFDEIDRSGMVVCAFWHTMHHWQRCFRTYAPVAGIKTLDELNDVSPGSKRHIGLQRDLLIHVLDEFD